MTQFTAGLAKCILDSHSPPQMLSVSRSVPAANTARSFWSSELYRKCAQEIFCADVFFAEVLCRASAVCSAGDVQCKSKDAQAQVVIFNEGLGIHHSSGFFSFTPYL